MKCEFREVVGDDGAGGDGRVEHVVTVTVSAAARKLS